MGARQILAHALCEAWGRECTCAKDPYEGACAYIVERAHTILRMPLERRLKLIQAIAGGDPDRDVGLHERLATAGARVPVPTPEPPPVEPGPTLNLDGCDPAPAPDDDLSEEQQMKRAGRNAWRA